jgi:preprotein translocase subunit YajC
VLYAATNNGGSSFTPFLLIVAFVVVVYFVLLRPNRRRQQAARSAHQDMLANVGEGTKIVTVGGLYGTIVDSDAESVTLEISPGVTARYDRNSIAKVLPDDVDDTESPGGVAYDDDEDIVDGADLDATHADADAGADANADGHGNVDAKADTDANADARGAVTGDANSHGASVDGTDKTPKPADKTD